MKRARRILSHHGSDCPDGPHRLKDSRCIILTRIDYPEDPGRPSRAWVSGDYSEGRCLRKADHTFRSDLTTTYGGGFWERVELGPKEQPDAAEGAVRP